MRLSGEQIMKILDDEIWRIVRGRNQLIKEQKADRETGNVFTESHICREFILTEYTNTLAELNRFKDMVYMEEGRKDRC